ncbi:hypothetical protein CEP54_001273 [Fusarium duplospermum]|uniref:Uncharacterized protein n=1 Tax=Fusarium duplospermum TaxID=1325734 RepID=A0A428R1M8_9HYPO|nr:hypothetical protein CEP54_001273 [Fusarium duplospermum]
MTGAAIAKNLKKLVLAIVALSSVALAVPSEPTVQNPGLQIRGDCYGYSNSTDCFKGRYQEICTRVSNFHKLGCRVQRTMECNEACAEDE